ncbi:MarR family winged helix-turn-helix transcriptional regulator [Streptomyces sp. NPDC085932]|uniref:MarR family winged helix-turn-helix transcriptional regulator n=1 Tax=Streptomyces sp. NPDC085932 TaxID=3365741 RepID=UPI0037CD66C1
MTRTIQRLEKAGPGRRFPSASDKRCVLVEPIAAGQALRRQVDDLWFRPEEYAAGDLTEAERADALVVFERLETNLAARTGDAEPPRPGAPGA